MLRMAPWSASSPAASFFAAVTITPVPSGLVRKRRSPSRSPPLMKICLGWTHPVTHRPYFGSGSMTVCPPAITPPASVTLSAPPRNTSVTIDFGSSRGKPATARAKSTCPPIA